MYTYNSERLMSRNKKTAIEQTTTVTSYII